MNRLLVMAAALSAIGPTMSQPNTVPGPWRSSDATLVQLCFDALEGEAPKTLRAATVSAGAVMTANFELVGRTTTDRPIYQAALDHPMRLRTLLVTLPGTALQLRIDAPADLPRHIDLWRPVPNQGCTAERDAAFRVLEGAPLATVDCPALGLDASLKVAAGAEHSLTLMQVRTRGPSTFNGLRGCREFVYGARK